MSMEVYIDNTTGLTCRACVCTCKGIESMLVQFYDGHSRTIDIDVFNKNFTKAETK